MLRQEKNIRMDKRISLKLRVDFAGILMQIKASIDHGKNPQTPRYIFLNQGFNERIVVTETRGGHTNVCHKYYFYISLHEKMYGWNIKRVNGKGEVL